MISKCSALLLFFVCTLSTGQAYELYHTPPEQLLQGVPGQLEVLTPHYLPDPQSVTLHLKGQGQYSYQELYFYPGEGAWRCDIPAAYLDTDTLTYYISASFGPAGLAAYPAENPASQPVKIPLIKFTTKGQRLEPELIKDSIVDYQVTPWKPRPAYRSNKFPVIYIPKSNRFFIESGFIRIVGNEQASKEDLIRSMMYLCLSENADAITDLKFSLLTERSDWWRARGRIELEGTYLRRAPKE
ncbi:MAG: hypothetical protein K9M49_06430 [Candidatus Marinimicrobia bacterium]|nr:hypothetical protein [Candidatus Neomarinimicrobiota bacterium]MCF7851305.1 hypothetical protein [Candidatus Neomarinimicrobiota bacterium]MCF7904773.1 hypothetical protein [Candidatus Neomarinimicrobiota bacterium]